MIFFSEKDMECYSLSIMVCILGVRLGGGMNYIEVFLYRFGILSFDGGLGEGLFRGLEYLFFGLLLKIFKVFIVDDRK